MFDNIVRVELPPAKDKKKRGSIPKRDIKYFEEKYYHGGNIPFESQFRFYNGDQLRLLIEFQIPAVVRIKTSVYTGEEVLLISLRKLAVPTKWTEVMKIFQIEIEVNCSVLSYGFWTFL